MAIVLNVRVPNMGPANVYDVEISDYCKSNFGHIHRRWSIIREDGYIVASATKTHSPVNKFLTQVGTT